MLISPPVPDRLAMPHGLDIAQEISALHNQGQIQAQGEVYVSDLDGSHLQKLVEAKRTNMTDAPALYNGPRRQENKLRLSRVSLDSTGN